VIKLIFAVHRLPHLSRDEFQKYWREEHAALAKKHALTLRIRHYVQVHTIDHPINQALRDSRGGPEPYDGVAELWWDSLEELAQAMTTPEGIEAGQALLEDEKRFIDLSRSPLWVAQEHAIIETE
jgi:uncharacterized protein (TIGR02118 family)